MDYHHSKHTPHTLAQSFKLTPQEAIQPASIINLSDKILGQDEISILSKGLNFIPKPLKPNADEVQKSLNDFSRRSKLAYFFSDRSSAPGDRLPFCENSNWTPGDDQIPDRLHDLLNELSDSVNTFNPQGNNSRSNITKSERTALQNLQKDPDIIIKPADKGSSTVIMNKASYLNEGYRQLSNRLHYRRIQNPVHPNIRNSVNKILSDLKTKGNLKKKQLEYLEVKADPRPRQFYLLPKIHKSFTTWPSRKMPMGRPIVSDCDSDTYRVAEYIDSFLAPIAKSHDSYIRDTSDFLAKLSTVNPPPNSFLATLDVESLYTNIDNTDGLEAVREAFQLNPDPNRPCSQILELLQLCLENNDFMFNGQWFLQTFGTAMGKKFAPNYANLFLAQWEKSALSRCNLKPDCYFRYLDDIFLVWSHSVDDFWTFVDTLNSQHPTIKLKATLHDTAIDFLDVTIFKGPGFFEHGKLDSKVYFKTTDMHELLHKTSYHPQHTFKGILKSQITRFYRICTHKTDFDVACQTLFRVLRQRGYSARFLRSAKHDTLERLQIPHLNPNLGSYKCDNTGCITCSFLVERTYVTDSKGKFYPLHATMSCNTSNLVYLIQCANCHFMYVGQTRETLHTRMQQHRSDIRTHKTKPVSDHFNDSCSPLDLTVTPLEIVPKMPIDHSQSLDQQLDTLKNNYLHILEREQVWIKRLNSATPHGLNKRNDIPAPIPFVIQYSDHAGCVVQIIKDFYSKFRSQMTGVFSRRPLIVAYKRNRNLRDILVRSSVKSQR